MEAIGNLPLKVLFIIFGVAMLCGAVALMVAAYSVRWGYYKESEEQCKKSDENLKELHRSLGYEVREESWLEKKFEDLSECINGLPEAIGAVLVFGVAIFLFYLALFRV